MAAAALPGCRALSREVVGIGYESNVAIPLDPVVVPDAMSASILANFFEGLSTLDPDMGLGPGLARSWINPDDHTWLLELREGVRFHDGGAMTAVEVKQALERARDSPQSTVRRMLTGVRDVMVVDDRHLKLLTEAADPLLMQRLSHVFVGREVRGRTPRFVGTGPYLPVTWKTSACEARAFDAYHGRRPAFDRVRFVGAEGSAPILQRLIDGEVDVARWSRKPQELPAGFRVVSRHGPGCNYLWFDGRPQPAGGNPFSDRRVRHAVSLALDRQELSLKVEGAATPAHQLVPEGVFGHVARLPELAFDPRAAQALLRDAGYPEGIDVVLDYAEMGSVNRALAESIRAQLEAVGIRAGLRKRDWLALVNEWRNRRIPFFLAGWIFEEKDAYSFLADCIQTRDPERGVGLFNPGISSPVLDELIQRHARIFAPRERLERYEPLMRAVRDEMPVVPVVIPDIACAVSARVRWQPRLDGKVLAAEMALSGPGR